MPSFAYLLPTILLIGETLAGGCTSKATAKAAYFITNGAKNEVVAMNINPDGKLSGGTKTFTQGYGSISIDGATKGLAATDGLVSQGSLSIVGDVSHRLGLHECTFTDSVESVRGQRWISLCVHVFH